LQFLDVEMHGYFCLSSLNAVSQWLFVYVYEELQRW